MPVKLRFLYAGLLTASFACVIALGGGQIKQVAPAQPPGKDKKGKEKEKRDAKPPEEDNIPYTFPYDRDAKNQLTAARDYLEFKNIPWNTVAPLLQNILESKNDSLFNTFEKVAGAQTKINRISVKTEANRIIAAFPKEGLEYYQQAYGATGSALLDEAIKANFDLILLAEVSQKFFHTKAGAEATVLLGSLYLERGNYLEAAYAFERFLARPNIDDMLTPRTLFKACLAFKRSGDARHADLLKANLEKLKTATEKAGLAIGRRIYSYEQLRAEIDRPLQLLRASTTAGEWAMVGGAASRAATIEGGPPFLDPVFRASLFPASTEDDVEQANLWIRNELEHLFARGGKSTDIPLPGFFPIATPDMVIFRGYHGVICVASRDQVANGRVIRAGDLRWVSKTNFGLHQMVTQGNLVDIDMYRHATEWYGTYKQTQAGSILYENPLLGGLSHDGQNVYFVDDVAIPPPPVYYNPNIGGISQGQEYRQSGDLADAIRAGRLVAVDLRTGMVKWELGRVKYTPNDDPKLPPPPPLPNKLNEEEADKTTSAFELCMDAIFLGAPLPINGKLYVLIEQAGVLRLVCLDPKNLTVVPGQTRKPTLVWSQKIGRPNQNLPQDSMRRYQGATLAASEGIIVCPTNSGAIVAVDTMSRSLLWAYAYREINPNERPRNMGFDPRTGQPKLPDQLDRNRWHAGGPLIANGRVVLTAYDSGFIDCLDLRSGSLLWRHKREDDDLYVGGIVNDRVIVVGRQSVRAYQLTGEEPAKADRPVPEPKIAFGPIDLKATPTGHGVGGKGFFYLPVRQQNAGRDATPPAEIWAINVETGEVKSKTGARKRNDTSTAEMIKYGLGNLVFQDGMVFAQSAWELDCFPQIEQKRAEMDRLLAANPKDPLGLLTRGELLLDEGKLKDAIRDFKESERNNLPLEKQPLLREKLYVAYTDFIRNDFASAESVLDEYKALCAIPADPNEAPEEKVRREDEADRRQRLYLYLLARGREGQGRLGEAFDNYISLANMGEAKSLLEMPDEPNVRMRPDVWARGRIEAMIRRSTNTAARKALEKRVSKEWLEVKKSNDLKKLRDFVAVFGPYFASGAEAQFLLSDRLLETNKEEDVREAQTYLAQLRVTGEEPTVRARATETLARLMVKNQYMEDAVSLYLELGKDYGDVIVRDGKTGIDFMTNLLTDKRLLPYLEPSRYPMPTRMKVEDRHENVGNVYYNQFEVEPQGDLFPMYRRFRYVLDQNHSGNGAWSLLAYDRVTGALRKKLPNLAQPMGVTFNTSTLSKFVQGNGQTLLLQFGSTVYCFDLAADKGKELWQKNLLGENSTANPQRYTTQAGPNGEIITMYDDGYYVYLGKATVLQAGYAALLTRDGLEVVEPLTRRVLWTRRDMKERTQLYGDARYIVLVETDSTWRPVAARVLRALDGLPVEGSGDSGRILANARSYQILGRHALLTEGTGEQPRVLRLYDLGTGKDVWRKEYDAKAIPIKSHHSGWTGFVKSNGEAEIIDTNSGKTLATLQVDAKNLETDLKPAGQAQLFVDADRYYIFLDREAGAGSSNATSRMGIANNMMLKVLPVNGALYAFDRNTNKRLWFYGNGLFENQSLVVDQFSEMPIIVAASPMQSRQNNNFQNVYPVVVIEKTRGRLLFDQSLPFDNQYFMKLQIDHKNGTISLNKPNRRIVISPDEPGTVAGQ